QGLQPPLSIGTRIAIPGRARGAPAPGASVRKQESSMTNKYTRAFLSIFTIAFAPITSVACNPSEGDSREESVAEVEAAITAPLADNLCEGAFDIMANWSDAEQRWLWKGHMDLAASPRGRRVIDITGSITDPINEVAVVDG